MSDTTNETQKAWPRGFRKYPLRVMRAREVPRSAIWIETHRSVGKNAIHDRCGVDLKDGPTSEEIEAAIEILDKLRFRWPDQK